MILNLDIFVVALCAILFTIYFFLQRSRKSVNTIGLPPGLQPENVIDGNMNEVKALGSLHSFLKKYHRKYGPIFSYWHGPMQTVSVASPELFQEMSTWSDHPLEFFQFIIPLASAEAVQYVNGNEGIKRYSMYSKTFNASSCKNYFDTFNRLARQTTEQWMALPKDEFILLQKDMFEFTINSLLESAFGTNLENDDAAALIMNVKSNYDYCWSETEKMLNGDFPKSESLREKEFKIRKDALWEMIRTFLQNRKELELKEDQKLAVDVVLNLGLTESQMVADLMLIFIGGFHTTALSSHQEIQEKVRAEVLSVLGDKYEVSPGNVENLKYLRQVLDETLRWAVIGPVAARVSDSDMTAGGYLIPAKMPVIQALGVVLHDDRIYPEPSKFDPERFTDQNERFRLPFSFEPFGFGKRKCPGFNFSYAEATVLLCYLLRSFKIELAPGPDQVVERVYGFVTKPNHDVWIIASPL